MLILKIFLYLISVIFILIFAFFFFVFFGSPEAKIRLSKKLENLMQKLDEAEAELAEMTEGNGKLYNMEFEYKNSVKNEHKTLSLKKTKNGIKLKLWSEKHLLKKTYLTEKTLEKIGEKLFEIDFQKLKDEDNSQNEDIKNYVCVYYCTSTRQLGTTCIIPVKSTPLEEQKKFLMFLKNLFLLFGEKLTY